MKKMSICLSIIMLITFLYACQKDALSLIEKLTEYQVKMQYLVDSDDQSEVNRPTSLKTSEVFSEQDPLIIDKEELLAIYDGQGPNTMNHVRLDEILSIYKQLLDDIILEINEAELDAAYVDIFVDFRDFASLDAHVEVLKEGHVLVTLTLEVGEETYHSGLKMGYEDEDFYLRELEMYVSQSSFYYFEFLENHQMTHLRYSPQDMWYRYQNQNDNTFYEIAQTFEGEGTLDLRWFDPSLNMRFSLMENEARYQALEFFNDKGIYFSYTEFNEGEDIELVWEILEATGWDQSYYLDETETLLGVYRGNVNLMPDARGRAQVNADIWATFKMRYNTPKANLTDEIINLSHYGLVFNYEHLNLTYIDQMMISMKESSDQYSTYKGIDFMNDQLEEALYQVIDQDIKP